MLQNKNQEKKFVISKQNYKDFHDFRQRLHEKFSEKPDEENKLLTRFAANVHIGPPGQFDLYGRPSCSTIVILFSIGPAVKPEEFKEQNRKDIIKKNIESKNMDEDKHLIDSGVMLSDKHRKQQ